VPHPTRMGDQLTAMAAPRPAAALLSASKIGVPIDDKLLRV
jgi:hypothetical protein